MNSFEVFPPGVFAGVAFVFGLIVGSFLNVVIHRLPRGESLVSPRSRCPHCQHAISALENIPVISYVLLRGRCRGCAAPISLRYPAIELLTGCVFAAIALRYGVDPMTPVWCVFAAALIAAGVIDIDHRIIPDEISLGGLVVAVVAVPAVQATVGEPLGAAVLRSLAGASLGGGLLWLVGFVHARVAVAMGREFDTPEGRHMVLALHHPLITAGPHGGHFSLKQHLFPLTDFWPWLYLPLPIIGSVYPLSRQLGVTGTDATSDAYSGTITGIYRATRPKVPILFAGGHEHSLQLHRDAIGAYYLVSGAGSASEVTRVSPTPTAMYAEAVPGYMRLDAHANGALTLEVTAVEREQRRVALRHCIAEGPPP